MKGYSVETENSSEFAFARMEEVDASYRDLSQVCGRIRNKKTTAAINLLEKASKGEVPIMFKTHNKRLGHRKELGGRQGRYPKKAAAIVLKTLKSAIANAKVKGLNEGDLMIIHSSANKKHTYGRMAAKGRRVKADFETARVEIILKGKPTVEKKVEVKKPEKAGTKNTAGAAETKTEKPAKKTEVK